MALIVMPRDLVFSWCCCDSDVDVTGEGRSGEQGGLTGKLNTEGLNSLEFPMRKRREAYAGDVDSHC